MVELFYVTSRIANLHGYKDVPAQWFVAERARLLFGPDGWLGVPYESVITGYSADDEYRHYCEDALEEFFTHDEAAAFVEFIKTHRNDTSALITPVELPIQSNQMGVGALPIGGDTDFFMIGDSLDYGLPFKVWGFMRFGGCTFDQTLPGARRQERAVIVHPDGDIEHWLLEDSPSRH
jgi:hypothetical protein